MKLGAPIRTAFEMFKCEGCGGERIYGSFDANQHAVGELDPGTRLLLCDSCSGKEMKHVPHVHVRTDVRVAG